MQTVIITVVLYAAGFFCLYLPYMIPDERMWFFTILGLILWTTPNIAIWHRVYASRTFRNVEKCPKWKHLINYIRRDNETVPLYGERAYPGESFLDIPQLGLMEFLGKDCYYTWGDKKYLWGLENINYTPDVRYSNLCHVLWELGFRSNVDVSKVLRGEDLLLMGKVFLLMEQYNNHHGAKKLVQDLRDYEGKTITFHKPVRQVWNAKEGLRKKTTAADVQGEVDRMLQQKGVN